MAKDIENMKFQGPKRFDISEYFETPIVTLPPKFKAPDYDRYDGTGCPRNHVRWFITLSQQHGLSREQMAQLFPMSLIGIAKKWFLRLKLEETRSLDDISSLFVEQFLMEEGIEITKRDLKQLKQGPQETFTLFIRRWRCKSAQLSQRMPEEDQIKLVIKSLSPQYFHFIAPQHYPSFDHLIKTGTQTEDAIAKGLRAKALSDVREGKRPMAPPKEVHAMNYFKPAFRPEVKAVAEVARPVRKNVFRQFDPLPYPLPMILKKLVRDKKIKLPDLKPVPNPLPPYWRLDQHCEYHRNSGHLTENCLALKHAIQNLIDKDELSVKGPNITQNPLPNHRAAPPPATNAIFCDEPILDPSALICAIMTDNTYVLEFDEEEFQDVKGKQPYILSFSDVEIAESSSSQSYTSHYDDKGKEGKTPYVLEMDDFQQEDVRIPYVLSMDDDELLLLDDQCDEMRHMTRGGRVFKPPELSADNPAEIARAADSQRQNRFVVSVEITPDELVSVVSVARTAKTLSFTDSDLPPEGKDHTKPLRITVVCNKKKVPEVLIDNGSALNVCPLSTATTLGFRPESFVPSDQGILAYDGTRRDVIGTLVTEVLIGGEEFDIEFQVLDIKASFLLLLGRPWLHKIGAVPFTLHQKLKFILNHKVVTVKGDPDFEVGQISQELTLGKDGDICLTGFSLEVATITIKEVMNEEIFFLSSTNSKVVRMIRMQGYIPGAGLGRYHQGMTEWSVFKTFNGLFGLGYESTRAEVKEMKRYMMKWAECRRRDESTGQRLPGLEIFFDCDLDDEPISLQAAETDWADTIGPDILSSLFHESSQIVAVISKSPLILNPTHLITPADGPLTNWTSQVLPQVTFQFCHSPSKESVVYKYVSFSESNSGSSISNDSFNAGTVEVKSISEVSGHPPEASSKERKTLQRLAANFIICGEELYRRSFDVSADGRNEENFEQNKFLVPVKSLVNSSVREKNLL
ncbi:uncharacterized protein LOC143883067 [Tasmannia lanceolata]|uniref:uncharacterized protein LOC143883067 n=1 Tax=Tasmannia lanceolata TaxID=3420 RepID=UPI0040642148